MTMRMLTHTEFLYRLKLKGLNDIKPLEDYKGRLVKIRVRDNLGIEYLANVDKMLEGKHPKIQSAINMDEAFAIKSRQIHGDKYNYSESIYTHDKGKLKIRCLKHGDFIQAAGVHLTGCGCPKCGINSMKSNRAENGWSRSEWVKFCGVVNADPKLYVIQCYSNNEQFIKIGITKNKIERRLSNYMMPYDYKIIKIVKGDAGHTYDIERTIKNSLKGFRYIPSLNFHGKTECYTEEAIEPIFKMVA